MDCASITDSADYNCTNPWGNNCTTIVGFDFARVWNITRNIQRYCPTDPRLFLAGNQPANISNAALTNEACERFAGKTWAYYPSADIWVRLTTWKFPLLQLVFTSPRPPLGLAVEGFVIAHLLGDPIGTIKDHLHVISNCQKRADYWRTYFGGRNGSLTKEQVGRAWKTFTIITISYDEWGKGDEARDVLTRSL